MSAGSGSKKGCLFWGALAVGILVLLGIVIGAGTLFLGRRVALSYTDTAPEAIQTPEVSDAKAARVKEKRNDLETAIKEGKQGEFRFDAEEINALVAGSPEVRDLQGRTAFRIDGDQLAVKASLPLKGVPGMEGRYLNGEFTVDLYCSNGAVELAIKDVDVKGKSVPDMLKSKLSSEFTRRINAAPKAKDALASLESIEIRGGKLIIRTRGKLGLPTQPEHE